LNVANFDPARWENPHSYDIQRRNAGHVGFGIGIHGRFAQMIARMEDEMVLRALSRQVGTWSLSGEPRYRHEVRSRRLSSLPVKTNLAPAN
jgi:cytochrome P450